MNLFRKIGNFFYDLYATFRYPGCQPRFIPADRYPEVPYVTREGMVTTTFTPASNVNLTDAPKQTESGTGWPEKTITEPVKEENTDVTVTQS
jgi:hypothetical protein